VDPSSTFKNNRNSLPDPDATHGEAISQPR
jgi:hypothetical protein